MTPQELWRAEMLRYHSVNVILRSGASPSEGATPEPRRAPPRPPSVAAPFAFPPTQVASAVRALR